MGRTVVDVDLANFHLVPKACLSSVFWELDRIDPDVDPRFEKEEWFSSTLLEWGRCGKLVVEDGEALAFAEYAPSTLFPRLARFPAARAASADACYLAYCFVDERHRGRSLGSELVHEVARDLVDRGYRAVEAVGDRAFQGSWVLPTTFLGANGFAVVYDDDRYPLMRLNLHTSADPRRQLARAAAALASSG
ncbi:MAG TPA: GNAT family N-acetyltransferase [Actinomycetota bacterium]|nr:GNAT family N-acetyltransferase [Actinomycetota bacterium]